MTKDDPLFVLFSNEKEGQDYFKKETNHLNPTRACEARLAAAILPVVEAWLKEEEKRNTSIDSILRASVSSAVSIQLTITANTLTDDFWKDEKTLKDMVTYFLDRYIVAIMKVAKLITETTEKNKIH